MKRSGATVATQAVGVGQGLPGKLCYIFENTMFRQLISGFREVVLECEFVRLRFHANCIRTSRTLFG
jgi:hypothetical protein